MQPCEDNPSCSSVGGHLVTLHDVQQNADWLAVCLVFDELRDGIAYFYVHSLPLFVNLTVLRVFGKTNAVGVKNFLCVDNIELMDTSHLLPLSQNCCPLLLWY